jgi:hypothetical protein
MSVFISSQWAGTTDPPIYAVWTAYSLSIVDKFTAYNTTNSPVLFKAFIGGTATSNLILEITIPAKQCYLCGEIVGHDLAAGESLYAVASAANAVSIRAGGRER